MGRIVTFALGLPALLPKKHDELCFFLRHSASFVCGLVLSSASLIAAYISPGFCSVGRFWCFRYIGPHWCLSTVAIAGAEFLLRGLRSWKIGIYDSFRAVVSFTGCVVIECA